MPPKPAACPRCRALQPMLRWERISVWYDIKCQACGWRRCFVYRVRDADGERDG